MLIIDKTIHVMDIKSQANPGMGEHTLVHTYVT